MTAFAELHHRTEEPLLLPNAWDHASATALAAEGFRAIGTTRLAVAAAVGLPDGSPATLTSGRRGIIRLAAHWPWTDEEFLSLGSSPREASVRA